MTPILAAHEVVKHYPRRKGWLRQVTGWIRAVDGVSLEIRPGESVGLVGESGCGKSTLARLLTGLVRPTSGEVRFRGIPLHRLSAEDRRQFRRSVQIIFQSPLLSLNPLMRVREIVAEPLRIHHLSRGRRLHHQVDELLHEVGLEPTLATRFPRHLSGGQRQRVALARALALRPELILCDEAVASLDLSVQRQMLELLLRLQATHHLAYLFISHHLGVVGAIAHRVLVMTMGRIVETGDNPAIFHAPQHPYTQTLLASVTPPQTD